MRKFKVGALLIFIVSLAIPIKAQINIDPSWDEFQSLEPLTSIPWGTDRSDFLNLISSEGEFEIEKTVTNGVLLKKGYTSVACSFNGRGLYRCMLVAPIRNDDPFNRDMISGLTKRYGKPTIDGTAYLWEYEEFGALVEVDNDVFYMGFINSRVKNGTVTD